jgi:SAM-dependent methyltransferase
LRLIIETSKPEIASAALPGIVGHDVPRVQRSPSIDQPAVLRIVPWITDGAVDYLETVVGEYKKNHLEVVALECGSGSSTGYLAQRVTRLVSIDHATDWHTAIQIVVSAMGVYNVDFRTEPRPYWNLLREFAEESFDVALIDGRDRVDCVRQVPRLLKPGGTLLVDNTERIGGISERGPYYEMLGCLVGWPVIHFEQVTTDKAGWVAPHRWITSVWRKPLPSGPVQMTTLGLPLLLPQD